MDKNLLDIDFGMDRLTMNDNDGDVNSYSYHYNEVDNDVLVAAAAAAADDDDDEKTIEWIIKESNLMATFALVPITITVIKLRDIIVNNDSNILTSDQEFMNTVKFIEEKLLINSNDYEAKISHRYYDEFIVK